MLESTGWIIMLVLVLLVILLVTIAIAIKNAKQEREYKELEAEVLKNLGFSNLAIIPYFDEKISVKSRQALENYNDIKFFREHREKLEQAENIIKWKNATAEILIRFLEGNEYMSRPQYSRLAQKIERTTRNSGFYRIRVQYTSPAGRKSAVKEIALNQSDINKFKADPSLLMGKGEYNRFLNERKKEELEQKYHDYYKRVNDIIDFANENKKFLVIQGSQSQLDALISQLYDRTVNSIKKIKKIDSDEWKMIGSAIARLSCEIEKIVDDNQQILVYYKSTEFSKIKETCKALMSSQWEFNKYIAEKVQSISQLFGTRAARNETVHNDIYNYIRPYQKTITPFTAEVSKAVFASAENNPLDYVVKYFYPNKEQYPDQIQKLYQLVEELETLRDAKQIIENYKAEYRQYLGDVPDFVMKNDEAGFYSRLGFANIDESVLTVEYRFSYTSDGGMAQRSFTVPMTEETIAELIRTLENKLTASAFAKEQRTLMTKKLRDHILNRDHFTCCNCGNSTYKEPNLLLEIDHIIPVSKGGCTVENNLQTLCWRCNRAKSAKIMG